MIFPESRFALFEIMLYFSALAISPTIASAA
jgi:hypothetical protein